MRPGELILAPAAAGDFLTAADIVRLAVRAVAALVAAMAETLRGLTAEQNRKIAEMWTAFDRRLRRVETTGVKRPTRGAKKTFLFGKLAGALAEGGTAEMKLVDAAGAEQGSRVTVREEFGAAAANAKGLAVWIDNWSAFAFLPKCE
ncbi:MAG: hypothetical protein ACRDD1_09850 [Planctomycetia bacterium]